MKKCIVSLLVIMMVFALIACSTSDTDESGREHIVVALDADVSTFHPSDHSTSNEKTVTDQIYDGLMRVSRKGSVELEPRVVKRYEISEDGMSYTFYLRDDITFHNGAKLTAEDVAFTLGLYQESNYQNASVAGLDKIEILDEYTVRLTTEGIYAPFLEVVCDIHIASKEYYESVDAGTFAQQPIGSGPYKFVSHSTGSEIKLEAYEDYYLGTPDIREVTFDIISDPTTITIGLQTGEVDFAKISPTGFETLEDTEGVTVETVPQTRFAFVAMNHEKYPYSEAKFRQAIAYAVDRQNMVDIAANGLATVNSHILTPERFGYCDTHPQYEYDPEKAELLLEELGISTPYDLGTMYVAEQYSTEAEILQNDLAKVGLEVKLEILEYNAYLQTLMNGDYGISILEMTLEGATQELNLALTTPFIGQANNARYSDPEVDQWFKDAMTALDDEKRFEIYDKIFTKVQEDAVYVILYNREILFGYASKLNCPEFELEGHYRLQDFSWK